MKPDLQTETQSRRSVRRSVLPPSCICGMCGGRGINNSESDCEHCDCGFSDLASDFVAAKEIGHDPHFAARYPLYGSAPLGPVNAARFVSDYADANLYKVGSPKGKCGKCEHYRAADNYSAEDIEDWCWLKEGKYAEGRENECPAWISRNAPDQRPGATTI